MVYEQLSSYIREQLTASVSKEDIIRALLAVGWQPSDVHEAFTVIEAVPPRVPTPTNVPFTAPVTVSPISTATPKRHLAPLFIAVGCLLLVLGGGVAYAYVQRIGPFSVAQYAESSFLSEVLSKSAQINAASYTLSASLSVDSRDKDAVAFIVPAPDPDLEVAYQNDARRMSDIYNLMSGLKYKYGEQRSYDYKTAKYTTTRSALYPSTLSNAEIKTLGYGVRGVDPVTRTPYSYAATAGGKNFTLATTFETSAAINTIRRSYGYVATTTTINGQKVIFTKDSNGYFYLPETPPKPIFVTLADSLRSISPDVSGSVAIGATTDFRKDGLPDWRFNATADGNLGDLIYKVDVEALKKDADYYVRINKMPALPFFSFSNFKGQWIKITPAAASSSPTGFGQYNEFSSLATGIAKTEVEYKKNRADAAEALKNLAQLADTEKLILFKTKPTRETVGGRNLYRYQLAIQKESIIPFYKDVLADAAKYKNLDITQDQGLLEYLQSKEFDDVFAYVENNTYLTLWTDKDGFPAILEYRLRVVPPDTATQLKDKQINIIFTLTLSNINKPVIIETPKDAKPIEDVIKEVNNNAGDSLTNARMKGNDAAIQSDFSSIAVQAEIYYSGTGNNSYGTQTWISGAATSCKSGVFKDATLSKYLTSVDTTNGDGKNVACYANGSTYLVGAELVSGGWWCVDSTGMSRKETGSLPTAVPQGKDCP